MTDLEDRLRDAFGAARDSTIEHPDLFARVERSIDDARLRRRFRRRLALGVTLFVAANAALLALCSDVDDGRLVMPWWSIELVTDIVLVALAVGLGPFIKRFGRAYAADVFRANPRTGKSYLVLTDVAYYLIFTAFILFTVTFDPPFDWRRSTSAQLEHEAARVGGMLLIMGVLHAANVVALPVIGRLLAGGRRDGVGAAPTPVGPGTWIVRVEPAPGEPPA